MPSSSCFIQEISLPFLAFLVPTEKPRFFRVSFPNGSFNNLSNFSKTCLFVVIPSNSPVLLDLVLSAKKFLSCLILSSFTKLSQTCLKLDTLL
jgi:hypothetical protein